MDNLRRRDIYSLQGPRWYTPKQRRRMAKKLKASKHKCVVCRTRLEKCQHPF